MLAAVHQHSGEHQIVIDSGNKTRVARWKDRRFGINALRAVLVYARRTQSETHVKVQPSIQRWVPRSLAIEERPNNGDDQRHEKQNCNQKVIVGPIAATVEYGSDLSIQDSLCETRHDPGPKRAVPLGCLVDVGKRSQWKRQVVKQEVDEREAKRCASERVPTLLRLFVDNGHLVVLREMGDRMIALLFEVACAPKSWPCEIQVPVGKSKNGNDKLVSGSKRPSRSHRGGCGSYARGWSWNRDCAR